MVEGYRVCDDCDIGGSVCEKRKVGLGCFFVFIFEGFTCLVDGLEVEILGRKSK